MRRGRNIHASAVTLAALAALAAFPVMAGEAGSQTLSFLPPGSDLSIGVGAMVSPSYPGARTHELTPYPYLSADIGPKLSVDTLDGIRYTALDTDGFSAGSILRYRSGRSRGSLPDNLRGLGGVDGAGELGGFAGFEQGPFSLDLVALHDVTSPVGGTTLEAHAALSIPFGDPSLQQGLSFGPFVEGADRRFSQANFGIDADQAAATGLGEYHPGAGLDTAGLELNGALNLFGSYSLRGFASWGRLVGDAANSPLVKDGGARDQLSAGLFIVFTP